MTGRTRAAVFALAVALFSAAAGFVGQRLYVRSIPPRPIVVARDADAAALLAPPLGERLQWAFFGRPRAAGPKLIALTFDDGPYPVDTPLLLAALADRGVHATFFLIGRDAELYPGMVRAIAAAGHEIANHTRTHPNLDRLAPAAVTAELRAAAAGLGALSGDPAVGLLFRPPHGRYVLATLQAAQAAGYTTVLWNDDPGDWREVPAAALAAHVARFATAPEILLLHSGRPETVAMLPATIDRFRAAGYTFVTAGELLRRVTPAQLNAAERTPLP